MEKYNHPKPGSLHYSVHTLSQISLELKTGQYILVGRRADFSPLWPHRPCGL